MNTHEGKGGTLDKGQINKPIHEILVLITYV